MPSSATKAAVPAVNAGTEETSLDHVTLTEAFKDGTKFDASYTAVLKSVMGNAKSRNAFMKAFTEHTKLSHSMVDLPKATEISNDFKANIEQQLTPPFGTKGFLHQTFFVRGTNWTLNVYAYRHFKSDDVTLIIVHSGSTPSWALQIACTFWTTPGSTDQLQRPLTYDTKIEDDKYTYHIDYTNDINMMGPDGKNPIVFKTIYKDNFTAQGMAAIVDEPGKLGFWEWDGPIYGLSIFHTSFKVGDSISSRACTQCIPQ
ncbi:hypothetical protein BDP27DRAFT_1408714 [Rhodocollybia butyracea]|uniref:MATH domain-containing protein n=1 Tax=Rhodocollybia butyracea TaxID=206335 RepID=A0A9P5P4A4_9AGAR|nr:hypothetical protein BDP27DRAFT_1408714 [Rhodocollybia butyracea]